MKRIIPIIAVTLVMAMPLTAQQPGRERMQQMREQVTQRFLRMYIQNAGLNDEQAEQFREVIRGSFEWNAEHAARERELWMALEGQMRPGIAADVDSLNNVMNALAQSRIEEAQRRQSELAGLREFLSPTQVAQFMIHMERFQRQVENIRGRRGRMGAGAGVRQF